jgi:tetratricopeptide (TPR) repeat protein
MENESKLVTEKVGKVHRIIRYGVAAVASVLLIFFLIAGYKFYTLSPEKLYAESYTAYDLITTHDGSDTTSPIEKAYKDKNYSEVIKLNRNLILSIKDIFLTGMAYLETKDYSRAVASFQIVTADLKNDKTALKDAAEYYLALAYLQNRDYDQAIELMNSIHDNSAHLYKNKFSRKYIKRVKRLKWR